MVRAITEEAGPEPVHALAVVNDASDHFYACMLRETEKVMREQGPNAPGPMDWVDPLFLTLKAASFRVAREVLRGRAVTFAKKDRHGPVTATAAVFVPWCPIVRACLSSTEIVPDDVILNLPNPFVAPDQWTHEQARALKEWIHALDERYAPWDEAIFNCAMQIESSRDDVRAAWNKNGPRLLAIRNAWIPYWSERLAPSWLADDVSPAGFEGVIRSMRSKKDRSWKSMQWAWRTAVRNLGGDKRAAAVDLAQDWARRSGSVFVSRDGKFRFNYGWCLSSEARRLRGEAEARRHEVLESTLAAEEQRGEEASVLETLAASEALMTTQEGAEVLEKFLSTLTERERLAAEYPAMTGGGLALLLGVTEGRVSQLRKQIAARLEQFLRGNR